jgi:hypothetical protein
MGKVARPRIVTKDALDTQGFPEHLQVALAEIVGAARHGLLALSVACGLQVGERDHGRRRGPDLRTTRQARPEPRGLPARHRAPLGAAGRSAGRRRAAQDALHGRQGGSPALLRGLHRPRSAGRDGPRPDAGRPVHPPLQRGRGPGGRRRAEGHVSFGDLAPVPPRHRGPPRRDLWPGPLADRPAGDLHRWDRTRRACGGGGARRGLGRDEASPRAVGGHHGEQGRVFRAHRQPHRPGAGRLPPGPVRDRRRQGHPLGDQGRLRRARPGPAVPQAQGAKRHRPPPPARADLRGPQAPGGVGEDRRLPGRARAPNPGQALGVQAPPAPRRRSSRGWRRRSPSPSWGSHRRCFGPSSRRTPWSR